METATGWEVIGFAQADLVAPGRYRLTRLLRGLEGTEGGVIEAGRRVLMLGAGTAVLPVDAHRIGESRRLRVDAGDSSNTIVVNFDAAPALPLAPVHLRAERLGDGSVALAWTRRSRLDGDGWGLAEPALDHVPEGWRVEIFNGSAPVRTMTSDSAALTYDAASQVADFGGFPSTFNFAVAQVSPVLGAGHVGQEVFNG